MKLHTPAAAFLSATCLAAASARGEFLTNPPGSQNRIYQNGWIDFDKDGYPFLADPAPPTPYQLQQHANAEARAYLAETDWYVIRKQENGQTIPSDILNRREAARAAVVDS